MTDPEKNKALTETLAAFAMILLPVTIGLLTYFFIKDHWRKKEESHGTTRKP